jgi:hypothetical protein
LATLICPRYPVLLAIAMFFALTVPLPASAQFAPPSTLRSKPADSLLHPYPAIPRVQFTPASPATSTLLREFSFARPLPDDPLAAKSPASFPQGTIERMEAAFYCNDTPFIDQVRLPLATLWRGRVRLVGFESDVTTANFVLGLPGAGTLHSLSLLGSGHLAIRTPPSDQLVGMHMTLYFHAGEVQSADNSGLRGIEYVLRTGRDFLQSFNPR